MSFLFRAEGQGPKPMLCPKNRPGRRGATLTELMVAVTLLSVVVVGFFGSFRFITKALYVSRSRTLATNLAQEKIETLKNLSYYELLLSTTVTTDNRFGSAITYDTVSYPGETISIGGITFYRYTLVDMAAMTNDQIASVSYNYPDTGLKKITVHVAWNDQGTWKKWTLTNLLENPNVNPLDSALSGYVRVSGTNAALPSATVVVEQNQNWGATADSSGYYSFRVYHGSYTVRASSANYYDAVSTAVAASQGSTSVVPDLKLLTVASGTIAGIAWMNPNIVISQVLVSSQQADGTVAQYIELYNPTTAPISLANCTPPNCTDPVPPISLNLRPRITGGATDCENVGLIYVSTYIASYKYFLIADTPTFTVGGVGLTADAFYITAQTTPSNPQPVCSARDDWNSPAGTYRILVHDKGGAVWLTSSDGHQIDSVGWSGPGGDPPHYEDTPLNVGNDGLRDGEQIVRISSPNASLSVSDLMTYGRAYDSNVNTNDFIYPEFSNSLTFVGPRSASYAAKFPIAGVPAVGARVSASDPLSGSTQAYTAYITSGAYRLAYAPFKLVGVTTTAAVSSCAGLCWTVDIASGSYFAEIATVTITQNQITTIPNANTVPKATGTVASATLSSSTLFGFVDGRITDIYNAPIPNITISVGGYTKTTGSNGNYFMSVPSGTINLTANPNNRNSSYVQQIATLNVETAQSTNQDFTLSLSGLEQGYLTSGTTPLPNFVVAAVVGGSQVGSATSDQTGYFTMRNLSTGTFTFAPVLDPGQDSSPNDIVRTISSAGTVFVGTFTVSGAPGYLAGTVTNNSSLVTTGALVLSQTSAIPASPVAIVGSSAPALSPTLYAVSSKADGTYRLPVRGNATYYLSVYVPTINADGTVSVTTKTYTNLYVTPSVTKTQDVVLP